jgi:hypothetical protein
MRWSRWCVVMLVVAFPLTSQAEATLESPAAGRPLSALSDGEFALVREQNGRRFWISKLRRVGHAKPKALDQVDDGVAFARLGKRTLPAALKPLVGASVQVHAASARGDPCTVTLTDWGVLPPPPEQLAAQAQRRFAKQAKGFWDKHEFTSGTGWVATVGESRFTVDSLQYVDGCEGFNADTSFVFRDAELLKSDLSIAFFPKLALDLNGDGMPEWLTDDELIGWDGKALSIILSVEPETYVCPC